MNDKPDGVTDMDTPEGKGTGAQASEQAHGQSGRAKGRRQSVTMQLGEVQADRDRLTQQLAEVQADQDRLTQKLTKMKAKQKTIGRWASIVVPLAAALIGLVGVWIDANVLRPPQPEPEGRITSPADRSTVTSTFAVTGTLSHVPEGRLASLAVLSQGKQVPLRMNPISSDERSWSRDVSVPVPAGQPFSLVLRIDNPGKTTIIQLNIVSDLVVAAAPCTKSPLRCLVTPAELVNGAQWYSFHGGGGDLTAAITDSAACRQPNKAVGLSVNWSMPANSRAYGGWGVYWQNSHVDLSAYSKMVLSIRGKTGGETFQIAMQDSAKKEATIESTSIQFVGAGNWQEMSIPLASFKGVNRASVARLSLGWNGTHGSGGICIDEIAFR